ncbi:MAG: hypothetical protein V4633_23620 [Pseudomonadota bacterium]
MLNKVFLTRVVATCVFLLSIALSGVWTFGYLDGKAMPTSTYVLAISLTVFLYASFTMFNSMIEQLLRKILK